MRLGYYRIDGHSTNSSSSHSVVIIPGGVRGDEYQTWDYGWENFTLSSRTAKLQYLATLCVEQFGAEHREAIRALLELDEEIPPSASIDHQSRYRLPQDRKGQIDERFLRDYREFFVRDDVVVLGGNDNSDGHPLEGAVRGRDQYHDTLRLTDGPISARWDEQQKYWCVYSPKSGMKARIDFKGQADFSRATIPELVDVKITNACGRLCPYCYQDSRPDGAHAPLERIEHIADVLGHLRVFEVALGGGEPTLHPQFSEILRIFSDRGVTPSYTTRNIYSVNDEVMKLCGGVAISVSNAQQLKKAIREIQKLRTYYVDRQVAFQVTMGTVTEKQMKGVFDAARGSNLTLLGYKPFGRGASHKKISYPWLREQILKSSRWVIGVDAALVEELMLDFPEAQHPQYGIFGTNALAKKTIDGGDGNFSMYIDAGAWGAQKHSYTGLPLIPLPEDLDEEDLLNIYQMGQTC